MEAKLEAKMIALKHQLESGNMKGNLITILKYGMKAKVFTYRDVEFKTGISESSITGRLSDLEDMGFFKKGDTIEAKDGHTYSLFSYISNPIKQAEHAHERFETRFKKWLNKSEDFSELAEVTLKEAV